MAGRDNTGNFLGNDRVPIPGPGGTSFQAKRYAAMQNLTTMRTFLKTAPGGSYTDARLDLMTKRDINFAMKNLPDSAFV